MQFRLLRIKINILAPGEINPRAGMFFLTNWLTLSIVQTPQNTWRKS